MSNTDRPQPYYFEADEDGYLNASERGDADGFAAGCEFTVYVNLPWLEQGPLIVDDPEDVWAPVDEDTRHAALRELLLERYPNLELVDSGADEHVEVSVGGDFAAGESTTDLYFRLDRESAGQMTLARNDRDTYVIRETLARRLGVDTTPFYHRSASMHGLPQAA